MHDCIFCTIAAGKAPASIVYQDNACIAFLDIQPVNLGHLLVIPNAHATYLADLDEATGGHLFRVAQRLANSLRRSGLPCEGVNLFLADGEAAMQEVLHVHLHVFPRFAGDGFGLRFGPNYLNKPERAVLDSAADQIRRALDAAPTKP
ncbi:MAG: HIT family protein [Herpetosiphonaceae bacterium]|nr:HIT family protein [Herpetosiphonaceae bacterium]